MSEYVVINGYLAIKHQECGCADMLDGCCEPIVKVETLLAERAVDLGRVAWSQVSAHDEIKRINRMLHDYGIDYPQGAAGVADLMEFAGRHRRMSEIAMEMAAVMRDLNLDELANHYDKKLDDA